MLSNIIAIDWSHTKGLATYNGESVKVETRQTLRKEGSKDGREKEEVDGNR